jgi:hypothetical protein
MPERITMKGLMSAHVAVLPALLGSHGDAQTTTDVGSVYTNLPVIPQANCMVRQPILPQHVAREKGNLTIS